MGWDGMIADSMHLPSILATACRLCNCRIPYSGYTSSFEATPLKQSWNRHLEQFLFCRQTDRQSTWRKK